MKGQNNFTITATKEKQKIASCARMMYESAPWNIYPMNYEQCLLAFEGDCKEIYILESEIDIVGFVILQVCGSFKGYIQTLCVEKAYRGMGLGNKLLKFSEEKILLISPNIFICVSDFNIGALKLYEDFGFKRVGELQDFVKVGITELLLRKTVGPMLGYSASPTRSNK